MRKGFICAVVAAGVICLLGSMTSCEKYILPRFSLTRDTLRVGPAATIEMVGIESNVAWKMKVKDGEELGAKFQVPVLNADNSQVYMEDGSRKMYELKDVYEAKKGETSVVVALLGNTDFNNDKTIILEMFAEGAAPAYDTLTVDRLSKVFLGFRKWPDVFTASSTSTTYYQPFEVDMFGSSRGMYNNYTWKALNGYEFRMHTAGTVYPAAGSPSCRMCVNSTGGLNLGTSYNMIAITLPGVPGKKIAKVEMMYGNTSTSTTWNKYGITTLEFAEGIFDGSVNDISGDAAGSAAKVQTVTGGALTYAAAPLRKSVTYNTPADDAAANPNSLLTFELPTSEVGAGYALVGLYATGIKWMVITYE
ncbi:MAG: hypothetical protein HUJ91_05345 [Bacteroidales bacterium]|nr:hypothetical protein [Bacteroidales bacterium]